MTGAGIVLGQAGLECPRRSLRTVHAFGVICFLRDWNGRLIWSFKSCKSSILKHVAPVMQQRQKCNTQSPPNVMKLSVICMVKHDDYMTPFSAWEDVSP